MRLADLPLLSQVLKYEDATSEFGAYVRGADSMEEAWRECPQGDWLLLIAGRLRVDVAKFSLAKGECANTVRAHLKDPRSLAAVDGAIAFGEGKITRKQLWLLSLDARKAFTADDDDGAYIAYLASNPRIWRADDIVVLTQHMSEQDRFNAYAKAPRPRPYIESNLCVTARICRKVLTDAVMEKLKL